MLFTIVIPYKDTNIKYADNCIKSLDDQIFKDFEVLFVHQNSSQLEELLKKSTLNYRTINMGQDSNVSVCRNKGIDEAKGEHVLFLDGDDFLHPNALTYAKQIIIRENIDILKLKVKKTIVDRKSTLKEKKQAFYKEDTLDTLSNVLKNLNVEITEQKKSEVMNMLFEENVLTSYYNEIPQSKLFKKISYHLNVHGFIFNKKYLMDNQIKFDESTSLYGEIPFLAKVYHDVFAIKETSVDLYYKLIHNDPINYPSLSQEEYEDRLEQFYQSLNKAVSVCDDLTIAKQIKLESIRNYLYKIVKNKNFDESFKKILPLYKELQEILNTASLEIKLKRRHKIELDLIKKGKFKKAYYLSKSRVLGYNLYQSLQPKKQRARQKIVQNYIFSKLPIQKNTIIYESFLGRNYSDSPKAIFKYLLENEPEKWKHIWVLNDKDIVGSEKEFIGNKNVKVIKRFSWRYFYYVTISKYFILNMRQPKSLYKKEEQIILSTWHGTPLKRLVFDMDNVVSANPDYKKDFYQQSRNWDYLIAANKYSEEIFESAFMYPKEKILTYGYPRNDILINFTDDYKKEIKEKLGIPDNKKVILYAPTWRDDEYHKAGQYKFNLTLDLNLLKKELGEDYVIILRMHYFISDNIDLTGFEGFAYDYSKYNDINDLYISSDVLITDYSSVFFDFANLKLPILFFTYDIDKYKDVLRGFYIDVENELPGPLLYTSEEVLNSIKNIEKVEKEYKEKYDAFYHKFCSLEDGKASERIVNKVLRNK
ncbi:bifunctional glycosyltransferase/CDP-glycerol:glycerophosphate glycerophosphotransferase [Bacillus sp. NPDC077027]|uniref:bifunctional glycosyltransferase/CDP-glycerol:glycerophosphate glycerophosphotransferase n=1 Tax=Bacillus sp. NPDC077027 TaxID=3390548 RepID=UPI003D02D344